MGSKKHLLSKKDYLNATLRSYILQNGFNYTNYQGTGYANILFPALKKIYKNDSDKLKKTTISNIEFYNVNPQTVPFVSSLQLALLDNGEDVENVRTIKMALMGPLAGIGDALSQFGIAPLLSTIFASMAMSGVSIAPLLFLFSIVGINLIVKLFLGWLGFKMGTDAIEMISSQISKISRAANIVGVTVISGLAVKFVKANLAIEYSTMIDGEEQIVALQEVFDQILPNILPAGVTLLCFYLIQKKGWNVYKVLALLIILGIALSYLGILQ
ncbi:PTS system mannose/fructose/sorbose family transporter subunit IID [Dolosigranulum pigrum]|uniref:PTS system mannose/fructose/sorbose family transporter subunit IID n=1 Tax=Dolosigranulum pigrum TaxID=29394 RepID=UPI000DBFFEE1|nr:PTS system mannose/fructose/sorbose family transporter subunit IID [Dolosigranulum pigrum]RAN54084.1 PTS N-acetylglucosamine transporter subunit IIBC [Dolosigranulum pigrum]RAN56091.1 PTS N-acetylglucosamine transporter subunit IIBC [Dolosigranulum pigrum]